MNKSRHTIRLSDEIWDKVKSHYRADDCTTQNEFVEKALAFYIGALDAGRTENYLTEAVAKGIQMGMKPIVNRLASLLFKTAVGQSMITFLLAQDYELTDQEFRQVKDYCVRQVRQINGVITYEDEYKGELNEKV